MAELPSQVEILLQKICADKSLPPPRSDARDILASLDELEQLNLLRKIQSTTIIRNLDRFIIYMVRSVSQQPTLTSKSVSAKVGAVNTKRNGYIAVDSVITAPMQGYASNMENRKSQLCSPQLIALGELEFRKAFIILSYLGESRLEEVISASVIRGLKDLSMHNFEMEVWKAIGQRCITTDERRMLSDWDSGRTHVYHCHVYPTGNYIFKGPYLATQRTHLHRVLGDENILVVKFAECENDQKRDMVGYGNYYHAYGGVLKDGIWVALRRYRFFVFKDGGKEERKKNPTSSPVRCVFVRMDSWAAFNKDKSYLLSTKTISEARRLFMHIHTVSSTSKYMARLSLVLSNTIKLDIDLMNVSVERIEDVPCRDANHDVVLNEDGQPLIHTDGTGYISEDLALRCPLHVQGGKCKFVSNIVCGERCLDSGQGEFLPREPPLLIQFRMFRKGCAVKGTLLLNRKLPSKTIQIRPSMIKVETDEKLGEGECLNSLEIVATSNHPGRTNLSRYLVALLSYGGVPKEFFLNALISALQEVRVVYSSKRAALRVSLLHGTMDDLTSTRMILSGVPLNEPWLQYQLGIFSREERKMFREGRIPVSDCFYLMGTADPTGLLRNNEVCIILDNGQISGEVLVFKHPGLHFGDIHVLNATYVKALEEIVGNAKYAIFFPTKGPRSLADEMANSDFDGDIYWVSRNAELLSWFKACDPWKSSYSIPTPSSNKPCEFSEEELEVELFNLFLSTRFRSSNVIGLAADSWLVFIDRLLTLGDKCAEEKKRLQNKILKLVDLYYCALDAPKSGIKVQIPNDLQANIFPHFMERTPQYRSTSILGQLYDAATEALDDTKTEGVEIWKLPCFDCDVPREYLEIWKYYYAQYREEITEALQHEDRETCNVLCNEAIKKYKQILYGAEEFEGSRKSKGQVFDEALAIYHICYNHIIENKKGAGSCSFAWKVAGSALCRLFAMKQGMNCISCSPSVLREILC